MKQAHVVLKSRATRPGHFRVLFEPQGYACKNPRTGSLYPVPPGTTRMALYCGQCKALHCLFSGRLTPRQEEVRKKAARARHGQPNGYPKFAARCRAAGLGTNRKPLKRTCWNCTTLRKKDGGFVCGLCPEDGPESMGVMIHRYADGCKSFGWRLVMEIAALE